MIGEIGRNNGGEMYGRIHVGKYNMGRLLGKASVSNLLLSAERGIETLLHLVDL